MTTELPGRTAPVMVSEVRPQIRGIIQKRLFTEGQQVTAGQVLYQIDPALYQADYDSAAATLARAEAALVSARLLAERYAELVKIEAVSKQQNDDAEATYRRAEADVAATRAALDTARITLEYTRITAPIGGQVSASVFTPGALVTANQADPLTTVRQLDPIYVDITQSSDQLLGLQRQLASGRLRRAGTGTGTITVRLRIDNGTDYEHAGRLAFTDVAVDETTGMVRLRTRSRTRRAACCRACTCARSSRRPSTNKGCSCRSRVSRTTHAARPWRSSSMARTKSSSGR